MKPGMTLRLNVTDMRTGQLRTCEFERLPITIGRDQTSRLRLEDATVSRTHATIEWGNQWFLLTDLGSANGTFVKGMRLPQYTARRLDWVFTFAVGPFVVHGAAEEVPIVSLDAETRVLTDAERARLHSDDAAITVVRRRA